MADLLREICERKAEEVALAKTSHTLSQLQGDIASQSAPRGFYQALQAKASSHEIGLIAEIKKASPSRGMIRADFNPAEHARAYAAGGATCLSVLTDAPYFQGCAEYLMQARAACALPVLRKDFMIDSYQMLQARAMGADCVLLIMACLSDAQARELEDAAMALGMDVLIEVHDETELERALARLSSRLIGINNRNLSTLAIDLATSARLKALLPETHLAVAESGIKTHADIARLVSQQIYCFLVGESLMLQCDITQATQDLIGNHAPTRTE